LRNNGTASGDGELKIRLVTVGGRSDLGGVLAAVIAIGLSASRRKVAASWLRAVSGIPSGSSPPFAAGSAAAPMSLAARCSNVGGT